MHAQLLTASKMFCGCSTTFGGEPNTQTCPVCQGMPGTLPVINRRAVEFGIKTALALGCSVNALNRFARKHYYYPDMPKNYQISQYEEPLAEHGRSRSRWTAPLRTIGIERVHLEEDVGKLIHEGASRRPSRARWTSTGPACPSWRSSPSRTCEAPTRPPPISGRSGPSWSTSGVCDGNMEEGSLRCDANISLRPKGAEEFGTKVEIKNLNSFRNVQHALEYEVKRQARALDGGERIVQETRLWDPDRAQTVSMRSKEYAHDYRYFPEPDLPPLQVEPRWVDEVRASLPELPAARRARFARNTGSRRTTPTC